MKPLDILVMSMDWEQLHQRSQQLATQLARYHHVTYLGTTLSYLRRIYCQLRGQKRYHYWYPRRIGPNLVIIPSRVIGAHRLRKISDLLNDLSLLLPLDYYLQSNRRIFDVVIAGIPRDLFIVNRIQYRLLCYDCFDDNPSFYPDSATRRLVARQENALINLSDVVIASSHRLLEKISAHHGTVHLIPNGADFDHFSCRAAPRSVPSDLASITNSDRPTVGFIGSIEKWVDLDLIRSVAAELTDVNFVLVGPVDTDISMLATMPNVFILGRRDYSQLPDYIHAFDVCMIPFKINELTRAVDPIKVYEYFTAGKPVVATPLPELLRRRPLVRIANHHAAFASQIRRALNERSSSLRTARIEYARANSWENRGKNLSALLVNLVDQHG